MLPGQEASNIKQASGAILNDHEAFTRTLLFLEGSDKQ